MWTLLVQHSGDFLGIIQNWLHCALCASKDWQPQLNCCGLHPSNLGLCLLVLVQVFLQPPAAGSVAVPALALLPVMNGEGQEPMLMSFCVHVNSHTMFLPVNKAP